MKNALLSIAIAICAAQVFATPQLPFRRGTNCRYLDEQAYSTSPGSKTYYYSLASTFPEIKAKGFDHVRLSVDLSLYYDSANDCFRTSGSYDIAYIDLVLNRILDAGLHVQLLQGSWRGSFNPSSDATKTKFKRLWELAAERYQGWSDRLSFELFNEPTVRTDADIAPLNELFQETVAIIRRTNPTRLILWPLTLADEAVTVESSWDRMDLPEDHSNIAIVIHCYAPMSFTHQGASWTGSSGHVDLDDGARLSLRWDFNSIRRFAESNPDIPLVLNEFGVMQGTSTPADVHEWLCAVREFCEVNNISWTHFEYTDYNNNTKQFAVRGAVTGEDSWRTNVVDALFPKGWDDQPSTYGQLDFSTFDKKLQVSFTGYAGNTALKDFPVLVKLSTAIPGFSYADFQKENGGDLRFADSTGKHIPHEIDTWDPNGVSTVWVRVPSLTAATRIYACYGCANPPAATGMDVWDDDYVGVWHLGGASLPLRESSRKSVSFTQRNGQGLSLASPGIVGGSVAFDGGKSNSLIAVDHDYLDKCDKYTFEVWTKQSAHKVNAGILCKSRDYDVWRAYLMTDNTNSATRISLSRNGNSLPDNARADLFAAPVDGSWRYQVCSLDTTSTSDNVKGYLNGALAGTESIANSKFYTGAGYLVLGNTHPIGKNTSFNGSIDEVRISKCIRSADWIRATHDTVAEANFASYTFDISGQDDPPPDPPQPSDSFAKAVKVAFTGYSGGAALTDFPVLVKLSTAIPGFSYADFQIENGGDLRFFDAAGNQLAHEIDTWDTSGVSTVWVKVPTLNASTAITAKYGCAEPPEAADPKSVWSNGYSGVWHMGGTTRKQADSTSSGKNMEGHATYAANMTYGVDGAVGKAVEQATPPDGGGRYRGGFQASDSSGLYNDSKTLTVEMWACHREIVNDKYIVRNKTGSTLYSGRWSWSSGGCKLNYTVAMTNLAAGTGHEYKGLAYSVSTNDLVGAWRHYALVVDNETLHRVEAYQDGASKKTQTISDAGESLAAGSGTMAFGNSANSNTNQAFAGTIDELRISRVARSADWIKATHDTVMNAGFATYEMVGGESAAGYSAWASEKSVGGKPADETNGIANGIRYAFDIDPTKGPAEIGTPIMQVVCDADGNPAVQTRNLAEGRDDVTFAILATPDLTDWSQAVLVPMEKVAEDGLWKPVSSKKSGYDYPAQMFFKYTVEVK